MSLDLAIEGGVVVDGTGGPSQRADVGVRDGRVVAVVAPGKLEEQADRHIDASGMVVSPGFIDVHTHLDAQVFWDPACTPVVQHGVTTAIAGNCGFSVAPLIASEADYLMRMLSEVEEIPLGALESAVDWNWSSMGEYLDRVEQARPAINLGFMVGHSAMRRVVMGSAAVGEKASAGQVAEMAALLEESLQAGGLGFSSSWHKPHVDGAGDPVPSRWASRDEVVELCRVVGKQPGTGVEFIPGTGGSFDGVPIDSATSGSTESTSDTMIAMSLAAQRPLNWNTFHADALHEAETLGRLAAADAAAAEGARVLALMYPGVMYLRHKLMNARWTKVPGWGALLNVPETEQAMVLADPERRAALIAQALAPRDDGSVRPAAQWDDVVVNDCSSDVNRRYEGRRLGDLAAELGRGSLDLACEIAVADGMQTGFRRRAHRLRRRIVAAAGQDVERPAGGARRV